MIKVLSFLLSFLLMMTFSNKSKAQSNLKSNSIIYADVMLGYSSGKAGGFGIGTSVNYQTNHILITGSYLAKAKFTSNTSSTLSFFPFSNSETTSLTEEFSILSGYAGLLTNNISISVTSGISRNKLKYYGDDGNQKESKDFYLGLPFAVNFKIFNKNKERFRIYGLIPIGKPTGLSDSYGIKIYGNLSRNSSIGIAVTSGFGYHKKY